jgi:peptide/nickel transport system substrate-binding protein
LISLKGGKKVMRILRWALFSVLALAAIVLAACGGTAVTPAATEAGGEETVAPPTEAGPIQDTIIICMAQEPDTLYSVTSNMAVSVQVQHAFGVRGGIPDRAFFYETQMLVNNEFPSFENGGATLENNVLSVTYKFKPEITWSDGVPFSVDDIIYTREVVLDPDSSATTRGILDQLTFEKIDDQTLKVTYPEGVKDPLYFIPPFTNPNSTGSSLILPKHTLENMKPIDIITSDFARKPNPVLGPYEVQEWTAGDNITLKAVPNWWGGEVKTPNLVYRFISDTNQLLASVLSGECDHATSDGLQLSQLPFIQQSADQGLLKFTAIPSTVWEHIDMNTWPNESGVENGGVPYYADLAVRQAVAYGTNRQQMTDEILYGEVKPLSSFLPSDHWAWNKETDGSYAYDPEKAKSLLADAGWADSDGDGVLEASKDITGTYSCDRGDWKVPAGTKFATDFHTTTGNAMREQMFAIFQSNMKDIGVQINQAFVPASVWFADDGPLYHRTFQIGEFAWVAGADPSYLATYGGINIFTVPEDSPEAKLGPTGPFVTADKIVASNPDFLKTTGISQFDLYFGLDGDAADAATHTFDKTKLPEGYSLFYKHVIPTSWNNYTGSNDTGWCNPEATQALSDGDNVLDPKDRLPFFLTAQKLFADDMPVLPLFQRVEVEASVNDLCGPARGPSNYVSWNVETWYFGTCE